MQETENYIWYTHSSFLLGKGATGKVFKVCGRKVNFRVNFLSSKKKLRQNNKLKAK